MAALLFADLWLLRRRGGQSLRVAAVATAGWTLLGLAATAPVGLATGRVSATHYLTVYVLERALSLDNVAVFAVVLAALRIPPRRREGLVVVGVALALVLRIALIGGGLALIHALTAVLYVFGALLVLTGVRTARSGLPGGEPDGEGADGGGRLLAWVRRRSPGGAGTWLPIAALAAADVIFAVDSIPAAFGVTRDAFPIVAANGFSVLGLHAAYVLLEHGLSRFRYLDTGVGLVLVLIGVELLTADLVEPPAWLTLLLVVTVIGGAVAASARPPR